jgi:hypothetical protein
MNFTEQELQIYRQELKDRVCSISQKFGYDDLCGAGDGECIIDKHLPRILEAVLSSPPSDKIVDYLPNLRSIVCCNCTNQDEQGRCEYRKHAYCSLDSFFTLVVETIEEVSNRDLKVV